MTGRRTAGFDTDPPNLKPQYDRGEGKGIILEVGVNVNGNGVVGEATGVGSNNNNIGNGKAFSSSYTGKGTGSIDNMVKAENGKGTTEKGTADKGIGPGVVESAAAPVGSGLFSGLHNLLGSVAASLRAQANKRLPVDTKVGIGS